MGNTLHLQKKGDMSGNPKEEEGGEIQGFTCEICFEPMESNNKFSNKNQCVHPFCVDCIAKYIEAKVEDKAADIDCPGLKCTQLLDPIFCRPIVLKPMFDKWCDNLCESTVLGFQKKCYCPYTDCSDLVLNECKTVKKSKCPRCKRHFCFKCKIPWHARHRCSESEQDRNDILFGVLVKERKWTRCPECGQSIERVGGCRKVKCRCGTRFCHICGKRPIVSSKPVFDKWCDNLNECKTVKKSKCPNCKKDFCFECKIPCDKSEQERDRNDDDVIFGVLVEEKNWTRCPRCGQALKMDHLGSCKQSYP